MRAAVSKDFTQFITRLQGSIREPGEWWIGRGSSLRETLKAPYDFVELIQGLVLLGWILDREGTPSRTEI